MIREGDRVKILKGYGYDMFNPQGFKRSDGTVTGVVTARVNQSTYVRLDTTGLVVETLTQGVERIEL